MKEPPKTLNRGGILPEEALHKEKSLRWRLCTCGSSCLHRGIYGNAHKQTDNMGCGVDATH